MHIPYGKRLRLTNVTDRLAYRTDVLIGDSVEELRVRESVLTPAAEASITAAAKIVRSVNAVAPPPPADSSSNSSSKDAACPDVNNKDTCPDVEMPDPDIADASVTSPPPPPPAALKPLRWKLADVLMSRTTDEFMPRCYMCAARWQPDSLEQVGLGLCAECRALNTRKWTQWDSIRVGGERVAIVTGARIKIGYQCALRLLRSGFEVTHTRSHISFKRLNNCGDMIIIHSHSLTHSLTHTHSYTYAC